MAAFRDLAARAATAKGYNDGYKDGRTQGLAEVRAAYAGGKGKYKSNVARAAFGQGKDKGNSIGGASSQSLHAAALAKGKSKGILRGGASCPSLVAAPPASSVQPCSVKDYRLHRGEAASSAEDRAVYSGVADSSVARAAEYRPYPSLADEAHLWRKVGGKWMKKGERTGPQEGGRDMVEGPHKEANKKKKEKRLARQAAMNYLLIQRPEEYKEKAKANIAYRTGCELVAYRRLHREAAGAASSAAGAASSVAEAASSVAEVSRDASDVEMENPDRRCRPRDSSDEESYGR